VVRFPNIPFIWSHMEAVRCRTLPVAWREPHDSSERTDLRAPKVLLRHGTTIQPLYWAASRSWCRLPFYLAMIRHLCLREKNLRINRLSTQE
jgi:hypothetical protein